ncbi:MAG: hypothetical protein Q8M98_02390 [Candidatus Cloacimonadaceae bacterium]|nr:hypothetical protein [Candidatus Cloacimonadaceae bacterium]MDP3113603.1 hypothetical protein [Candidatus Cloacimonadaceae bacterium]
MRNANFKELFTRYSENPIIQVSDIPYKVNSVFNAGVTKIDDDTLLLMRVEDRRGLSHLTVARSLDGITNWRIDSYPTFPPQADTHPEEIWGIEDPRITRIESRDLWVIVYTAFSKGGPLVAMATTHDFKIFDRIGAAMPPEDKDAALFPVKFGGRWAMLHRPVTSYISMGSHIWISFSPDMRHWGDHQILLPARKGAWWDANKVGLSPPPLQTEKGWLILYHGVKTTASGCIYRLGLALLDLEDPTKILARSDEWVFAPETEYEIMGDVDKVVFPCGWIADKDEIRLYYGSADKCIALATGSISEILEWLEV